MPDTFVPFIAIPNAVRLSHGVLTAHDRETLRALRRRLQLAVATLDDVIECGHLDRALDGLGFVSTEIDGQALAAAATLGSR